MFLNVFAMLALVAVADGEKPTSFPEHLTTHRAGRLVITAIKALGGWDDWKSKRNVQYERDSTRFELAGIVVAQSGRPFTPVLGRHVSGTGQLQDRPNVVGDPRLSHPDPAMWFRTAAFTIPANSTFGNAGRDILIGPGLVNQDFSLIIYLRFGEARKLEIRAEFFNIWNHPNFSLPNATADSAQFGKIFAAGFSRQVQFGAKFYF